MSNWIIRLHDRADRSEAEVRQAVTEALVAAGFNVESIHRPLRLNPDPLKIRPPRQP